MTDDERDDAQETITVRMSDGRCITLVTEPEHEPEPEEAAEE